MSGSVVSGKRCEEGHSSNSFHAAANRRNLGETLLTQLLIDHGQALVIGSAPRILIISVLVLGEPLWGIDVHSCAYGKQMSEEKAAIPVQASQACS